ncbi:MAG: SprT family zinc-dependent metalloprotease [Acutalibacter sp.]|nr:SprT family zinc-dependent metalloprotease [Acutalibacter sp.]
MGTEPQALKMCGQEGALDRLMATLLAQLRDLQVPVSPQILPQVQVNTRAKRRLGCCRFREGMYTIEVSAGILQSPDLLKETLLHELLHTCPGCRNHGPLWKSYAAVVNQALGTSIQRTVKVEEVLSPLRQEEVKYVLRCQSCGREIKRLRMCKVVKAPWRYRCLCGGKLKRVR